MENSNQTSQPNKESWFSDISWKTALICAALGIITGGGTGSAVSSAKTNQGGISQDQADVRYLTKEEAEKRSGKRDVQLDRIEKKIDDAQIKLENEQKEQTKLLFQILNSQKNERNN